MKVTEAMEKGLKENPNVKFAKLSWFFKESEGYYACAIGLALIGLCGIDKIQNPDFAPYEVFQENFEADPSLVWTINDGKKFKNGMSDTDKFKEIIKDLKEQGI